MGRQGEIRAAWSLPVRVKHRMHTSCFFSFSFDSCSLRVRLKRIYLNELIFVLFVREEKICKHNHLRYFMLFNHRCPESILWSPWKQEWCNLGTLCWEWNEPWITDSEKTAIPPVFRVWRWCTGSPKCSSGCRRVLALHSLNRLPWKTNGGGEGLLAPFVPFQAIFLWLGLVSGFSSFGKGCVYLYTDNLL